MTYQVIDDDGQAMDAHVDVDANGITVRSRSGSKALGAKNTEYGPALRLLLKRLIASRIRFDRAWVDSFDAQRLPIDERIILWSDELTGDGSSAFTLMSRRMKLVGRSKNNDRKGGNSTKRTRIEFAAPFPTAEAETALRLALIDEEYDSTERLPAADLHKVTADYLWEAVERLSDPAFKHQFGQSTDYDLVLDDDQQRLPPEAVFGVAASAALGFEVLPKHFTGGAGSICFRIFENAGFVIVRKGEPASSHELPDAPEDREWAEGKLRLVIHLRKERAGGLAAAKKLDFIKTHGRLFCEQCGMDPVKVYNDPHGVACIEVHHAAVHVEDMSATHRTKLEDVRCLCANCHRYVHRLLKAQLVGADADGRTSDRALQ